MIKILMKIANKFFEKFFDNSRKSSNISPKKTYLMEMRGNHLVFALK